MKKNYLFIYCVIILFIYTACHTVQKVESVPITSAKLHIPDSLYPSPTLVIATHNEWTRGNYPKMIAEFKAAPLQLHDVVFLGNSITRQGRDWSKKLNRPGIKNRGIAGDVTDGVLHRLSEIVYIQPTAIFLEIGVNDLFDSTLSPERTAANIIRIMDTLHQQLPHTKLFVQTIFPTDRQWMVSRIQETNNMIRKNVNHKAFTLIDTHALFADDKDRMKKELTVDGVHLNEQGYGVWVNCLKAYFK